MNTKVSPEKVLLSGGDVSSYWCSVLDMSTFCKVYVTYLSWLLDDGFNLTVCKCDGCASACTPYHNSHCTSQAYGLDMHHRVKTKKASIRWQDSARRQFEAGLRGDVGL